MKSKDASFIVKHVAVQRQIGRSDCGVFAIAFATSLCTRIDLHTLNYNQTQMRPQLIRSFEGGHLLPFHTPGKLRRMGRAYFLSTKEVPVFCVCRLPWNKDNAAHIAWGALVQYSSCKEWYHQFCCNIDDVVLNTPKYKYLCSICKIYDVGISVAYLPFIDHPVLSVIITMLVLNLDLLCMNGVMCGNSH